MASNYPSQIPITDTNADVWEIVSQSEDELVIRPVASISPTRTNPAISTEGVHPFTAERISVSTQDIRVQLARGETLTPRRRPVYGPRRTTQALMGAELGPAGMGPPEAPPIFPNGWVPREDITPDRPVWYGSECCTRWPRANEVAINCVCGHRIHEGCLTDLLRAYRHDGCPVCRNATTPQQRRRCLMEIMHVNLNNPDMDEIGQERATAQLIRERVAGWEGVTGLGLNGCDFSNGLPPLFLSLNKLNTLRISDCKLKDLPDRVSGWEDLTELELADCDFSEGLPPLFLSLNKLHSLKISHCDLKDLPERVAGWEVITELELNKCDFSDGLPPLFLSLNKLHSLKISHCKLKDLPDRVAGWKGVTELELNRCDFSDGLPPLFLSLKKLHSLKISDCKLKDLPDRVAGWEGITELELSRCDSSDGLPPLFSSLKKLHSLKISDCKLKDLPDRLAEWEGPTELELNDCRFISDGFPPLFVSMSQNRILKISDYRGQPLPKRVAGWKGVTELELNRCDFSDGLPTLFLSLNKLHSLKISHCKLKDLPDRVAGWESITELELSGCDSSDGLPPLFLSLNKLHSLEISDCKLKDLPDRLAEWEGPTELELNDCRFISDGFRPLFVSMSQNRILKISDYRGQPLPKRVAGWKGVTELELNRCDFSDGLPTLFLSLNKLHSLKISHCKLKDLPDRVAGWEGVTELELNGCDFSDGLPPLFLSLIKLHSLKISDCKLKDLPDRLAEWEGPTELELNDCIFISDGFRPLFVSMSQNHILKISNYRGQPLPKRLAEWEGITELELNDCTFISDGFPPLFASMSQNRILKISDYRGQPLPKRVAGWEGATELELSRCDLSDGLPPIFLSLNQLHSLKISDCKFKDLPDRLAEWEGPTELELNDCRFISDGFPPLFASMSQNHILKISDYRGQPLPKRVAGWEGVTELELNNCDFSDGFPPLFLSLNKLHSLKISACKLKDLPDRVAGWEGVTELELSGCDFFRELPPLFLSLNKLHSMKISHCELIDLPDSVRYLTSLKVLDLSGNQLETLPSSVYYLPCIELVNLGGNRNLESLGSLIEMSKLERFPALNLSDCSCLRQPPVDICHQGTDAIKRYYMAMGKEDSCLLSLVTVGVLGESFAGKTSIVKSLKLGRRHLTNRLKRATRDETTVVFNNVTVDIYGGKSDIRFIDLGGNGVYHPTYKLTLKSSFLPIVVINIKRFVDLSRKHFCHEKATRQLCFDWLAQFYLANPDLSRPLLVLTHKDKLSQEEDKQQEMEKLLKSIAKLQRETNLKAFRDLSKPIFEKIFVVGDDDSFDELHSLLTCIEDRCKDQMFNFPVSWWSMMQSIESREEPYLNIESLKGLFMDTSLLLVMLRFLHRSGRIIWYENMAENISSKVFHDTKQITRTVGILFNHQASEQWNQRKDDYEDDTVTSMIAGYQRSGMIHKELLIQVLQDESEIPVDDALTIMKSFYLIYGPIHWPDGVYYAVPYLSTSYRNNQWMTDGEIRLRLSVFLDSPYALPQHAYHQMALLLASLDCHNNSSLEVKRNGATIYHQGWKIHFIHDHNNSQVTLQASTRVEKLVQSWASLRTSVRGILDFLSREWEAVRPKCIFYCGSCLLTDQLRPDTYVNPSWCTRPVSEECCGTEMVYCDEESCDVPACLVKPCSTLSADGMEYVRKYIHDHLYDSTTDGIRVTTNEDSVNLCTPALPTQQEETWETPRELNNLMNNSADSNITLTPCQTPEYHQELYFNTDKVYLMSEDKRGRALIISNKYSSCLRRGAEQDFINLKRMFESFHFDVVGEHKDYTAQEIHDTIVRETEEICHYRYGMFALVITSHGNDGLVYGYDDYSIKLSDIYGLLSATKFPAMKGKPKLVIIEACSGAMMDAPTELGGYQKKMTRMLYKPPITVSTAHDKAAVNRSSQMLEGASNISSLSDLPSLSMDHLLIIKSSLPGFGSMLHPTRGSWLVRALVIAFYKYAHSKDLEALCKIACEQVRLKSIDRSQEKREARGQIPDLTCTFTNGRSVYLFPGYHGKPKQTVTSSQRQVI